MFAQPRKFSNIAAKGRSFAMTSLHFFFFFIASRLGVLVMDVCVRRWIAAYGKNVCVPSFRMSAVDYACVVVNGLQKTYFLMTLYRMTRSLPLCTLQTPVTVFCIFVLDDMLYGPFHKLLHHRSIYSYVHKRHHIAGLTIRMQPFFMFCRMLCTVSSVTSQSSSYN